MRDIFSDFEKLSAALSLARGVVAYVPMGGEPDWENARLPLPADAQLLRIPTDKHTDPFAYAAECTERFGGSTVAVFIPGRLFDCAGTRHGRGGGWYDRFLSRVPKEWVRIGVADSAHVSREPLSREEWDEPMDWILAHDAANGTWKARETRARTAS